MADYPDCTISSVLRITLISFLEARMVGGVKHFRYSASSFLRRLGCKRPPPLLAGDRSVGEITVQFQIIRVVFLNLLL